MAVIAAVSTNLDDTRQRERAVEDPDSRVYLVLDMYKGRHHVHVLAITHDERLGRRDADRGRAETPGAACVGDKAYFRWNNLKAKR